MSDLNKEFDKARAKAGPSTRGPGGPSAAGDQLRELLFNLPGGSGSEMARDMDNTERIRASPEMGGKPPDQLSPQELHSVLWQVLSWRDSGTYRFGSSNSILVFIHLLTCMYSRQED